MSKLLVLGASAFQLPAILHAQKLGHHVISCDYLPENPGHRYAHESCNLSTTDHEAVLAFAQRVGIDGVLAYASDPAACTAAHIAEEMRLPGLSRIAAATLSNKAIFRRFLQEHGFSTPRFCAAESLGEATEAARSIGFPVMVKPCDSSGSKGVSRVEDDAGMHDAYAAARRFSRQPTVVVEQWIERRGRQIAGDGLVLDGQLVFGGFGDEHFDPDCCPHAPVGESFPGELDQADRQTLDHELQRLFTLLGIRDLVFNLDAMFDRYGRLWLIEIGPRAGGNCLPQLILEQTDVDLTEIAIRLALGEPVAPPRHVARDPRFNATWMIHARRAGRLAGYRVAPVIQPYIRRIELTARLGSELRKFQSSADTAGFALLSFPTAGEMHAALPRLSELIEPVLA